MDKLVAKDIITRLNNCLGEMNSIIFDHKDHLSAEESMNLKRVIAKVMNTTDRDLIKNIVAEHPELSVFKEE
ncbi:MAG: hypothetical protein KTR16_03105 [Acidiferrobacterales bacterium]|nr:hypothetical protein [Acidiferrobacterales bacterium]